MYFILMLSCLLSVTYSEKIIDEKNENQEYFKISIVVPKYKSYSGFYRKIQGKKHLYKKPRVDKFLMFHQQVWSIGNDLNEKEILVMDECSVVTMIGCNGPWRDRKNNSVEVKVESIPSPLYPEYYQLQAERPVDVNLAPLLGFYKKMPTLFKKFPSYKKSSSPLCMIFLHMNGHWTLNYGTGRQQGFIRSRTTSLPSPSYEDAWEFWNATSSSTWEPDPSIFVLPFEYPDYYFLEYTGEDLKVKELFDKHCIEGYYFKDKVDEDGIPSYLKVNSPLISLSRKSNGRWTISISSAEIMYQHSWKEPAPSEYLLWLVKIGNNFDSTPGVVIKPVTEDAEIQDKTILICVSVTLVVLVICVVFVVFLRRRRAFMKKELAVEKNEYYGNEDEYYDEHDNRVEDINDYYE